MEHFIPVIIEALHVPNLWELLYKTAIENPWLAFFGLTFLAVIIVRNGVEVSHQIATLWQTAKGKISIAVVALAIVGVSGGAVLYLRMSWAPVPVFDPGERIFVREPAIVSWRYSVASPAQPVVYEVQIAKNAAFGPDTTTQRVDGNSFYSYQKDGRRTWRVRATADGGNTFSDWSKPVSTIYYPDALARIADTKKLIVYVSNSINQSIFKYVNGHGQLVGADIDIANGIVGELAVALGTPNIAVSFSPVPWADLLGSLAKVGPNGTMPDLIISSITKLQSRQKKYDIKFSLPYYCTTLSLVHRGDFPSGSILDMIREKSVGYQAETTSQRLAELFAQKVSFRSRPFDQTNKVIEALLANQDVDFAITDSPFAIEEFNKRPDVLRYRPLQEADFEDWRARKFIKLDLQAQAPNDVPREMMVEEYAIAVHNSEGELATIVDAAIKKWSDKNNGTMAAMLERANQDHAAVKGKNAAVQWAQLQAAVCRQPQ